MTYCDYIKKKNELKRLSYKISLTETDKETIYKLIADISLYEANHGKIDENNRKNP